MRILLLSILCFGIFYKAEAQQVTFAEHIAPIIYNKCGSCHRPGEIAPFSLTNYAEVKDRGNFIKYVTGIKYMPPFKPERGIRDYQKQNFLSDEEINLISTWVDQGMERGDPNIEPQFPVFPTGSQIGTPDMVVSFAQSYLHKGTGTDEYRYFVIPTHLTETKYLTALEVRPGNKKVVHHTLIWADSTSASRDADAATPEYGFSGSSSSISGQLNNQLPGYVPGQKPIVYTDGLAMRIPKNSDLLLQMHYAPSATDEWDSTSINLFFSKDIPTRFVQSYVMLPIPGVLQGDVFVIPPNTIKEFHGLITLPYDVTFLGVSPHMHLLGRKWEIYAVLPNQTRIDVMKINDWDFNWQGAYNFVKPVVLPKGSQIHAFATYDNTTNNPYNPNNPPKTESWGEKTSDEMYYLPLIFMTYQPGDENLVFGDILDNKKVVLDFMKDKIFPIYPDPSKNKITVPFTLSRAQPITVDIIDLNGKVFISKYSNQYADNGMYQMEIDIHTLPAGSYFARVKTSDNQLTQKFIKL